MNVLGVRCSPKEFAFVVLSGTMDSPQIVTQKKKAFPKAYSKIQSLKWFGQEIEDTLSTYSLSVVVMKGAEGMARRGKPFEERLEYETIVYYACAQAGINSVTKKMKGAIAKSFGYKGQAHYLSLIDTSKLPGYSELSENMQDAVLAAWSELPE